MFNPLVDDMSDLTDTQVDEKVSELSKKYFQTKNAQLRSQVASIYEMYTAEAHSRRARAYQQEANKDDNDLDNLININ